MPTNTKSSSFGGGNTYSISPSSESTEETTKSAYEQYGDSLDDIYYKALDDIDNADLSGKSINETAYAAVTGSYDAIASVAPYLVVFSILLCVFICFIAKRNKQIRRRAIIWLGIVIPVALIIFIFGVGASPIFRR